MVCVQALNMYDSKRGLCCFNLKNHPRRKNKNNPKTDLEIHHPRSSTAYHDVTFVSRCVEASRFGLCCGECAEVCRSDLRGRPKLNPGFPSKKILSIPFNLLKMYEIVERCTLREWETTNVHMALITPPAIKYANSRFTIIKPPRNKVRQLFFPFFSVFSL